MPSADTHGANLCKMLQEGCHTDLDVLYDPRGRAEAAAQLGLHGVVSRCLRHIKLLQWRPERLGPDYWPGNTQNVVIGQLGDGAHRFGWCLRDEGANDEPRWLQADDVNASHVVDLEPSGPPTCAGSSEPFLVLSLAHGLSVGLQGCKGSCRPLAHGQGNQTTGRKNVSSGGGDRILAQVESLLSRNDRARFERATREPFGGLMGMLREQSTAHLGMIFQSTNRFPTDMQMAAELNVAGLTALRKMVFERALIARRQELLRQPTPLYHGIARDAAAWEREGIRVLSPFDADSEHDRSRLLNLLRMITADPSHHLPCSRLRINGTQCTNPACCEGRSWLTPINIIHAPHDDQYAMHIDTVVPSIKMYIYPAGVSYEDGPFHYANGSHMASDEMLRWLHLKSMPPALSWLRCGAARTQLRDERVTELGFREMTPLVMQKNALVVADTSGGVLKSVVVGSARPLLTAPQPSLWPIARLEGALATYGG